MRFTFLPALLIFFAAAGLCVAKATSPTTDEVAFHMVNGYTTWKTNDYRMNPASPPWARKWVALPWLLMDLKLDLSQPDWKKAESVNFGRRFFYQDNRMQWEKLLLSARAMNLLLGAGLIGVVFLWSRHIFGWVGAMVSSLFLAFTPAIMAHSAIAGTDLAVAFYSTTFLYALWRFNRKSQSFWLVLAAICLGLAGGSKFTALMLYPSSVILLWIHYGWKKGTAWAAAMVGISLAVIWASYGFEWKPLLGEGVPRIDEKLGYIAAICGHLFPRNENTVRVAQSFALHQPIPLSNYILGIAGIVRSHEAPYGYYFFGQAATEPRWYYYGLVFILKMTPAFLAALIFRIMLVRKPSEEKKKLFLFVWLPIFFFFAMTLRDTTAVGLRYILPVIPLLCVWLGGLIEIRRVFVGALLAAHIFSFTLSYPHLLEYFNGFVGGTPNAYRCFRGSDVDWGQGLRYLEKYLKMHGGPKIALHYFGTADPSAYMIHYRPIEADEFLAPRRELYAVSVHYLDQLKWLKGQAPDAKLGSAIFIYDRRNNGKSL